MKKILYLITSEQYNKQVIQLISEAAKHAKRICYITLNKTTLSLRETFKRENIDAKKFYFVDTVTPQLFKNVYPDNCLMIESLDDMKKFRDVLRIVVRMHKADLLVFDSLSSLLAYKSDDDVARFLERFLLSLDETKTETILLAMKQSEDREAIKQASMMVDETIRI